MLLRELIQSGSFYHINQIITLTTITLSIAHSKKINLFSTKIESFVFSTFANISWTLNFESAVAKETEFSFIFVGGKISVITSQKNRPKRMKIVQLNLQLKKSMAIPVIKGETYHQITLHFDDYCNLL
jgi:hypothetical protein